MRIKRIEVIGFKSFCDRTVIHINSPVTSVVGPNGCGKSNIVDAIRWCMGEQSAKHLRGKAMDDVIFAGSENRGQAAMCEVSLTFEDVGFSHETVQFSASETSAPAEAHTDGEPVANPDAARTDRDAAADADADAAQQPAEIGEADAAIEAAASNESTNESTDGTVSENAASESAASDDASTASPDSSSEPPAAESSAAESSAADDVKEFLDDKPPVFDFTRYSEVTITRRLYRDGTSQYLINRTPCRLRDVTDFFLGTGVGTKAYSIIEQGRVGMIVSARPQDRRTIIEEAAGITKFKTKKRAAERKLEQTRQNLLRVSDIVSELEQRMGTLRRQAQKAERYRRYKAEIRDIELWKAAHRYLEIQVQDQVTAARLSSQRENLTAVRNQYESKDGAAVAERAELAVEERRIAGLQEEIYDLENRIKLAESKIDFHRREATELDARVRRAQGEIDGLKERQGEVAAELVDGEHERETLEAQAEAEEAQVEGREIAVAEAKQMVANGQSRLEEARRKVAQANADLARAESQREAMKRQREEAERRLSRVVADVEALRERTSGLDKETRQLKAKVADLRQTKLDLGEQVETLGVRKEDLEQTVATATDDVDSMRAEVQTRRSRLQSLREIQDKFEGFDRGTRSMMEATAGQINGFHAGTVRGLVADAVTAPAHLEAAVEAALGQRLGGLLVSEADIGLEAVAYLREKRAGRAAFVPCNGHRPNENAGNGATARIADASASNPSATAPVPTNGHRHTAPGVIGDLADLVPIVDEFAGLGRTLFADYTVVDTLENAVAQHQQWAAAASDSASATATTSVTTLASGRRTFVTLEGDIVDGHGVVFGGSRDGQGASILAQKREIRELDALVDDMARTLADKTAHLAANKSELAQVTRSLEAARKQTHEGEIALLAADKDLSRLQGELDRHRERLGQLGAEQLELEERLGSIESEDGDIERREREAVDAIDRYEREQLGLIEGVTDGQARLEELNQLLTEARIRTAQLNEKRAAAAARVTRLSAEADELAQRLGRLASDIDSDTAKAAALRAETSDIDQELQQRRQEHVEQSTHLGEGKAAYEDRLNALQLAEMEVRELRKQTETLSEETSKLEIALGNLRASLGALIESTWERYQIELAHHLCDYHLRPQISEVEDKRLDELKRLIARMGSDINLTAIDEYAEVSERHQFLDAQKVDLESAVEQLEAAIAKINKTSRRLFRDTYNAVNAKFQEVFPRLFRGGQARLKLTGNKQTEAKDIDILDAGVEIIAQPPGKKNSTVDQLSGGEKALTAVALIFSIFLIKPSPFCILDEVDAPLDDANVDRYNEVVREMTDRSQFIIITHNKRTMEIADNLYGVTMEEPGVSKLVSVNLSKLDERAVAA